MSTSIQQASHSETDKTIQSPESPCQNYSIAGQEYDNLVRLAKPLYKEMHSSDPWYQARMHDEYFWKQYILSGVEEARTLVENSQKCSKECREHL